MTQFRRASMTVFIALLSIGSMNSMATLKTKQLAGPPEEFSLMKAPNPELNALQSKTAMLDVNLKADGMGGWQWQTDLAIDTQDFQLLVFATEGNDWTLTLQDPVTLQNKSLTATHFKSIDSLKSTSGKVQFGMDGNKYPATRYTFDNAQSGQWRLKIKTKNANALKGFIMIGGSKNYLLKSYKSSGKQVLGGQIHFVSQAVLPNREENFFNRINLIDTATMKVTSPDGLMRQYAMFDDGLHGDRQANDGIFGGDFFASDLGNYQVQIIAKGENPQGAPFLRTTEHLVPIVEQSIQLEQQSARATLISNNRLSIKIPVKNLSVVKNNHYRIIGEVWGQTGIKTKFGLRQSRPVSWISTISGIENNQLNIQLDNRWIARSKTKAPFYIRNLRVEEVDNFIPLISVKKLPISLSATAKKSVDEFSLLNAKKSQSITEQMRMGPRPTEMTLAQASSGLLLVHGYCSSDVWGPVSSQFSNAFIFKDLNANRSNDAFARKISAFGANMNSYGIVAHSQGGNAALHLYTYYWSGLDRASGNRMIQSVGSPYQGTPLAGNLAALGNVFGVGCGTNSNLTTSGASSWLAGIPSWARSKVYYSTTSFSTKWWRYDYCSIATDLFLSDPEDGVVEKSRGQLSGANNMGHKKGWCHTSSMRDTAQTKDSSRNADMNANAMR